MATIGLGVFHLMAKRFGRRHSCNKQNGLDSLITNDIDEYLWVNKLELSNNRQLRHVSILQEFFTGV